MYQYTEAFCHYSRNSPEAKKTSLLCFTHLEKKSGQYGRLKKCAKKCRKFGKTKLSDTSDPNAAVHNKFLIPIFASKKKQQAVRAMDRVQTQAYCISIVRFPRSWVKSQNSPPTTRTPPFCINSHARRFVVRLDFTRN